MVAEKAITARLAIAFFFFFQGPSAMAVASAHTRIAAPAAIPGRAGSLARR